MQALKPQFSSNSSKAAKVNYRALPDCDLIVAFQKHDEEAFTVLYERHVRLVRVILFRLSPDLQSCHDDMVQEVFLRVWKSLYTLKNTSAFKTWLSRLVTNIFYDELRKRPAFPTMSLDRPFNYEGDDECASRDIVDVKHQPDDHLAGKQLMEQINVAIALLPRQFAKVVALRELEGLSYEEISTLTKSPLGTVKSRIARARTRLQLQLQPLIA